MTTNGSDLDIIVDGHNSHYTYSPTKLPPRPHPAGKMGNDQQLEICLPPVDGTLTVLEALTFQCQHNPVEPMFLFSTENAEEPTKITFQQFGRACDRVAQLIHPKPPDLSVVGIILVTDVLQYQFTLIGLMRAGFVVSPRQSHALDRCLDRSRQPFPISPHLSPDIVARLLRDTSTHHLIVTSASLPSGFLLEVREEIKQYDSHYDLRDQEMPELSRVFTTLAVSGRTSSCEWCPRTPSLDDLALYLHSSGSTGTPKPIPQTHRRLCQWASISKSPT